MYVDGSMIASTIFWVLFALVSGIFIYSVLARLDQVGRPTFEQKALLLQKKVVWTNQFDMSFRPIHRYYGKVSVNHKTYTVRIHEGDFDNLHNGEWHMVTFITGWSGATYAIKLKP